MTRRLLLLATLGLLLLGCGEDSVTTQVFPVQAPLPAQERAVYRVLDRNGAQIGRAVFTIEPDAGRVRFIQEYEFGAGERDRLTVLLDPLSLRPLHSAREVHDRGMTYLTEAVYEEAAVAVTFRDGRGERTRRAGISDSTYDNLESLVLWRTLEMAPGAKVSYGNVIVDPRRGTINRALGTVTVAGKETLTLPAGMIEAWRLDFRAAGLINRAWYAATPDRRLLRYEIARGPVLELEP